MLCFALRYSRRIVCSSLTRIRMLSNQAGTGSGSSEAANTEIGLLSGSMSLSTEEGTVDSPQPFKKPLFTKEEMCA